MSSITERPPGGPDGAQKNLTPGAQPEKGHAPRSLFHRKSHLQVVPALETTDSRLNVHDVTSPSASGGTESQNLFDHVSDSQEGQSATITTAADKAKGGAIKAVRRFVGKHATSISLTASSFVATEGVAHVGTAIFEAVPNPVLNTHNPWVLGGEIMASYVPVTLAQMRSTRQAIRLQEAGKKTFNVLATGAHNVKREKESTDGVDGGIKRRVQEFLDKHMVKEQLAGASPQGGMEVYWWVTAGLTALLANFPRGAAVIAGANVGGWVSINLQNDLAEYHLRRGTEPSKGIKNKLKAVPRAAYGVAQIKIERNAARVRNIKDKIIPGKSQPAQPELTVAESVVTQTLFEQPASDVPITPSVPHQQGA